MYRLREIHKARFDIHLCILITFIIFSLVFYKYFLVKILEFSNLILSDRFITLEYYLNRKKSMNTKRSNVKNLILITILNSNSRIA